MKKNFKNMDDLIWTYLDGSVTKSEFEELQRVLESDAEIRKRYQLLVEVHHALGVRAELGESTNTVVTTQEKAARAFGSNQIVWLAAAACLTLLFGLSWLFFSTGSLKVQVTAVRDVDWRGAELAVGDRATTRMMHLMHGAVAFDFPTQTQVVVEGPAIFQVSGNDTLELSSGTLTVHHHGEPGSFKVITPVGSLMDMGTKFGVQVGNGVTDSIVMTEVYEGEVMFDNGQTEQRSLKDGEAYAIIGNNKDQELLKELNGQKVKVAGTFELASEQGDLVSTKNLALGKPVSSTSYYNVPEYGEVFPPSALTDGRLNDTGSPWNWSFWLATNLDAGAFTLDLLEAHQISRIELLNTRNRHYGDRGAKDFRIEVSVDGEEYLPLLTGKLKPIEFQKEEAYQFEVFSFQPAMVRYLRFIGETYYGDGSGKTEGGGLGEIRVFE